MTRAAGLAGAAVTLSCAGARTDRYAEGAARGIESWARRWLAQAHNDFEPGLLGASPDPLSTTSPAP